MSSLICLSKNVIVHIHVSSLEGNDDCSNHPDIIPISSNVFLIISKCFILSSYIMIICIYIYLYIHSIIVGIIATILLSWIFLNYTNMSEIP